MARKKLSEFRAKTLLGDALGTRYEGLSVDLNDKDWQKRVKSLPGKRTYVVKVDQGVKGRFKKGLVFIDRTRTQVFTDVKNLNGLGYRFVLVEPYVAHVPEQERYLSLKLTRAGTQVVYSKRGGVDVEVYPEALHTLLTTPTNEEKIENDLELPGGTLAKLAAVFNDNHLVFLEINPLVVRENTVQVLDAAVEADETAETFVSNKWSGHDFREHAGRRLSREEQRARELASKSQASFTLETINPNGSIFLLLSGGGASVVVADEIHNLKYGKQLGNYGEYSGNPNAEETQLYTEQVLSLLIKSKAKNKVLIIGGGVANFTDVLFTFKGVLAALKKFQAKLRTQGIKVYVRRGGPHQEEGLASMRTFLKQAGLLGEVAGPEMMLADIVGHAMGGLRKP